MNSTDENPYAPPAMQEDQPVRNTVASRELWLKRLIILHSLVIVFALLAQAYEVESIMGSGPVFAINGLLIAVLGFRTHNHPAAWYGVSAVAFALLIVFLINFNRWGPAMAERPVIIMSAVYGLAACPVTLWLVCGRTTNQKSY